MLDQDFTFFTFSDGNSALKSAHKSSAFSMVICRYVEGSESVFTDADGIHRSLQNGSVRHCRMRTSYIQNYYTLFPSVDVIHAWHRLGLFVVFCWSADGLSIVSILSERTWLKWCEPMPPSFFFSPPIRLFLSPSPMWFLH